MRKQIYGAYMPSYQRIDRKSQRTVCLAVTKSRMEENSCRLITRIVETNTQGVAARKA